MPTPGADGEGTAAHHRRTAAAHLAAAASAGLASSLVRVPTEVVKTRMQTGQFSSARAALRHIVAKEGRLAAGLFAGFGSFLLRDLPFDAIEFASYEQLKLAWCATAAAPSSTAPRPAAPPGGTEPEEEKAARGEGERTRRPLKQHESAVLGAVAGMVTGAVTTPLDVVKTRLMTQGAEGRGGGGAHLVARRIDFMACASSWALEGHPPARQQKRDGRPPPPRAVAVCGTPPQ